MNKRVNLGVIAAITALVGGCTYLGIPMQTESPTSIGHLSGPTQVVRGQPVTVDVWAFVGVNGSYSPGPITATVNDAERTVSIKATSLKDGRNGSTTLAVIGYRQRSVQFTPGAAGTYRISAERPAAADDDDYQPFVPKASRSTTFDLVVTEP